MTLDEIRKTIDSMLCEIENDDEATIFINGVDFRLKNVCYETRSNGLIICDLNCNMISSIYYDDIKSFKVLEYRNSKCYSHVEHFEVIE